jgi:hypothetical protein
MSDKSKTENLEMKCIWREFLDAGQQVVNNNSEECKKCTGYCLTCTRYLSLKEYERRLQE